MCGTTTTSRTSRSSLLQSTSLTTTACVSRPETVPDGLFLPVGGDASPWLGLLPGLGSEVTGEVVTAALLNTHLKDNHVDLDRRTSPVDATVNTGQTTS